MPAIAVKKRGRTRAASEELDGDIAFVKRSKKTGRPTRSSAGRKSLPADFVNPDDFIEDESASDYEEDEKKGVKKPKWSMRKRCTSPPRALPPAEPFDDIPFEGCLDMPPSPHSTAHELAMTFHIPPGHTGPFVVKLDLGSIFSRASNPPTASSMASDSSISAISNISTRIASCSSSISSCSTSACQVGFLCLPAELRNYIYRLVFVTELPVNLRNVDNFCRSAALLATCQQVHSEGVEILYGENKFELDRQWRARAAYYQKNWTEIGYKDCFRFLSTIGPRNISLVRDLTITFEDGSTAFVEDNALIECIKLFAHYGRLETLKLGIHGRKQLRPDEYRFLDNLRALKADEVKMISRPNHRRLYGSWIMPKKANVYGDLDEKLIERMQRKERLWKLLPISTRTRRKTFLPVKDKPKKDVLCPLCGTTWPTSAQTACCYITSGYFNDTWFERDAANRTGPVSNASLSDDAVDDLLELLGYL